MFAYLSDFVLQFLIQQNLWYREDRFEIFHAEKNIPWIVTKLVLVGRLFYFCSSCGTHECFTWAYTFNIPRPHPQGCIQSHRYMRYASESPGHSKNCWRERQSIHLAVSIRNKSIIYLYHGIDICDVWIKKSSKILINTISMSQRKFNPLEFRKKHPLADI